APQPAPTFSAARPLTGGPTPASPSSAPPRNAPPRSPPGISPRQSRARTPRLFPAALYVNPGPSSLPSTTRLTKTLAPVPLGSESPRPTTGKRAPPPQFARRRRLLHL